MLSIKSYKFRPRYADEGLEDFDSEDESPVNAQLRHARSDEPVGSICELELQCRCIHRHERREFGAKLPRR